MYKNNVFFQLFVILFKLIRSYIKSIKFNIMNYDTMGYKKVAKWSTLGIFIGVTAMISGLIQGESAYAVLGWFTCTVLFCTVVMLSDVPKD